ncbi:MAG: HDOD domain-containing protein [Rhodocyclaceae bacterium]|nr:HDOD domain-containing protein [Rhodocyclaceae bacterium]
MSSRKNETNRLQGLGIQLPPQPQVLVELQRLMSDDQFDMRQVARVIAQDPAIVALLFRIARSPVFSRGRKIESLEQVLMVVGIRQVYALVQAESLVKSLSSDLRGAFEIFWARAREIAHLAALIADERGKICRVPPEQAYLAGIFHECGVPVLMMRFPAYCQSLRLDDAACWPDLAEEDARFGVDHCSVGYLVARHWGLPDYVCEAIRYHHEAPEEKSHGPVATLLAIVQLAAHAYHQLHRLPDPLWAKIGARALAELGLAADEAKDYCEQIIAQLIEAT